jgi:hypothetical protein
MFDKHQEGPRKDVECGFGGDELQGATWWVVALADQVLTQPSRLARRTSSHI